MLLETKLFVAAVSLSFLLGHFAVLEATARSAVAAAGTRGHVWSTKTYFFREPIPEGQLNRFGVPERTMLSHVQRRNPLCFLATSECTGLYNIHSARLCEHRPHGNLRPRFSPQGTSEGASIDGREHDAELDCWKRLSESKGVKELEHSELVVSLSPLLAVAEAWPYTEGKFLQS